jgi:acyl CoA:acetate/3-ketoacid CoA transferase alpha subunit
MWLPSGYKDPFVIYLVEKIDEQDGSSYQLGGFTTEGAAAACIRKLESEGWRDLHINTVAIHERLTDWQWDR